MVVGTLYTYPQNFRAYKALIAARYSGNELDVAKDFVFGVTNQTDDFKKQFPLGKVPALSLTGGDHCLIESNAIAYYVADDTLQGGSHAFDRAKVLEWMTFADTELLPVCCNFVFPIMGIMKADSTKQQRSQKDVQNHLKNLNDQLKLKTYLVGEGVTLADITVFCVLLHLFQYGLSKEDRKAFCHVTRWFNTILNQKHVKEVVGEVAMCDEVKEVAGSSGRGEWMFE